MTQQEVEEIFLIYAAGAADTDERRIAEALLRTGGPSVQAAYAEALAVVHSMPLALEQVAPPAGLCDRLMARIAAEHAGDPIPIRPSLRPRAFWPTYLATAIAACLAIALTASLMSMRHLQDRNKSLLTKANTAQKELAKTKKSLQSSDTSLADARSAMSGMQARLSEAVAMIDDARSVMQSPTVSLASLDTKDETGHGFGRVLYCKETRQYQVMVFDLKAPPPGKVYELWLITTDKKKLPAGTFTPDKNGGATVMALAPEGAEISIAAVTDEPMGGVQVPTGSIRLAGALAAAPQSN